MQDDMNPENAGQRNRSQAGPAAPGGGPADQSRKAVWLAMGAVALALGLIWVAPGIEPHATNGTGAAGFPGEPEDAARLASPRGSISR